MKHLFPSGLGDGEGDRGLSDAAGPDNAQQPVPL